MADPIDEIRDALKEIATYPVLTDEVNGQRGSTPSRNGASGGGNIGSVVEATLKDVLGWRPRADDPKAFVSALTQSFSLKEVEGSVHWKYTPRGYAVQADLGAVTGAQASIYKRAKVALDEMLPLLDGLKPLRVDADPEDTEAMRLIIRQELVELVGELGIEGGPRVKLIDDLFVQLLGPEPPNGIDPNCGTQGQMRLLRDRFGFEKFRINNLTEEQNFTNYLVLLDYTCGLRQSWVRHRESFVSGSDSYFLGTQLVQLSRVLAAVAESVEETYFAMDSVFLGPEERQIARLTFIDGSITRKLTIEELSRLGREPSSRFSVS